MPFEIASTPVRAVVPLENAWRIRKRPMARTGSTSSGGGSGTGCRVPSRCRTSAVPTVSAIIATKKNVGTASTMPDSFTPRRLTTITKTTSTIAEHHPVVVDDREGGGHLGDPRGDRDGDGQDVVHEQRRAGHLGRELPQVVAGHDVGPAPARVGVDRLLVREGDDGQQDDDRHRDRQDEGQGRRARHRQDDHDLLGRVGGGRERVRGEDREAHGLADRLVRRVRGRRAAARTATCASRAAARRRPRAAPATRRRPAL